MFEISFLKESILLHNLAYQLGVDEFDRGIDTASELYLKLLKDGF